MSDEVIEISPDETSDIDPLEYGDDIQEVTLPSLTYRVVNGRIIGRIDEQEAMLQAIDKLLKTERFIFNIYDDQYGHDLNDLIGKDYDYVLAEVDRMLKEAIGGDDRVDEVVITSVEQVNSTSLAVSINVSTMFGEITTELEVNNES